MSLDPVSRFLDSVSVFTALNRKSLYATGFSHKVGAGGYAGTSMGAIAERAGITRAVLYDHFASKQALYLWLLEERNTGTWLLERDPYLLETSIPGIFAAGDVRHGSIKRVASSVGEGSMAIAFIHQYLAELRESMIADRVAG